jgi:hypothetical protein
MKKQQKNTTTQPKPEATFQRYPKKTIPPVWLPVLHVLGLLAVLIVLRYQLFDLPLERDESAYAYLGRRAAEGLAPYRDFYEMKPPLLFYSYAALTSVFGYSLAGLRWIAFSLSFVNTVGIYAVSRTFLSSGYAFLAGLIYLLFTVNPYTNAIVAASELVVMSFAIWGLYGVFLFIRSSNTSTNRWHLILAGAMVMAASMVKQTGVLFMGVVGIALIAHWLTVPKPRNIKILIGHFLWVAAGALVVLLANIGIIFAFGTWDDFWYWNVVFPMSYSKNMTAGGTSVFFEYAVKTQTSGFEVLWILSGAGILTLWTTAISLTRAQRITLLTLLLCSAATIYPGQRFYGHYWLQLLPALAIFGALAFLFIGNWLERSAPIAARAVVVGLTILVAGLVLGRNIEYWSSVNEKQLIRKMYQGNPFGEDKIISDFLKKQMRPDDRIGILGSEPQYYVYLDKKAPTRHFYTSFLSRPVERSEAMHYEALKDFEQTKPEYLVFNVVPYSWMFKENTLKIFREGIYSWMMANYEPIAWYDHVGTPQGTLITGAAAATYAPKSKEYVMVMKRR